jgi:hypothetical protein
MDDLKQKLLDSLHPGCIVEFDPDEAEAVGAFEDDALSLEDAAASAADLLDEIP